MIKNPRLPRREKSTKPWVLAKQRRRMPMTEHQAAGFAICESSVQDSAGHPIRRRYTIGDLPFQHWITLDDIDFYLEDRLSGDEAAQCLFGVAGGILNAVRGETENYYVLYDPRVPGTLDIVTKGDKRGAVDPAMLFGAPEAAPNTPCPVPFQPPLPPSPAHRS